jgi:hypothetical protein
LYAFSDGGGIRGLWSLYALEKLMEYIADAEEVFANGDSHAHSFLPMPWPSTLRLVHVTNEEKRNLKHATDELGEVAAMSKAKRYLPCHYFDCIGGSSTGA